MAKWLSKEEKLKIIKISKIKTIDKTALEYGIGRSTIKEWIKSYIANESNVYSYLEKQNQSRF